MLEFSADGAVPWMVVITIIHVLGITSSVYRICYRVYKRLDWWDDYMVAVPMLLDATYFAFLWVRYNHAPEHGAPTPMPIHVANSYWGTVVLYFCVVWTSRIVLTLSLARSFAPGQWPRIISFSLAVIFFFVGAGTVTVVTVTCRGPARNTVRFGLEYCKRNRNGYIIGGLTAVSLDFAADLILIICPFMWLWRVKLAPNLRRLVLAAFSASIFTMIAATFYCVVWYGNVYKDLASKNARLMQTMSGHLEASISLLVCNTVILVAHFYNVYRRARGLELESYEKETTAPERNDIPSSYRPTFCGYGLGSKPVLHLTTVYTSTIDSGGESGLAGHDRDQDEHRQTCRE